MLIFDLLKTAGVLRNEASLYLYLLRFGPQSAYQLSQSQSIAQSTARSLCQRLERKGWLSSVKKGKGKVYQATPLEDLSNQLHGRYPLY